MGLFGFRKSKSSNINELIKHFSVIHNMIDRKINLLSKGEIRDDINMVKSESFAINLYKEGVLKGLGSCSIDNTKGDYKIDDKLDADEYDFDDFVRGESLNDLIRDELGAIENEKS